MNNMEAKIKAALKQDFRMLIGGELVSGENFFDSINPASGQVVASIPSATRAQLDQAVVAANQAQPGWAALDLGQRQAILQQVSALLREHSEEWGLLDSLENGNVFSAMRDDAKGGAWMLDYFCSIANEVKGESTQIDHNLHYSRHEPFGVVARLLPFNHPIQSLASAIGAPLLMGNCLILKPSPHSSLSALSFGAAIKDIVPAGVINILSGSNEVLSQGLMEHPDVPRIAATGSTEVGRLAMRLGAERLKTVTLELGGKTPMIVFDDADLELAVDTALRGMNFKWQGHSCSSTSRVLVHAAVHDEFVQRLKQAFEQVIVGQPFAQDTEMGAISHENQYHKIQQYIESGQEQGATLVCGGKRPEADDLQSGFFITPAIFCDVKPSMRIAREEIYGPVISILKWETEAQAIEIANDVDYGLAAVIVTNSLDRAHVTAQALQAGYIEINGPVSFAVGSAFGGMKLSGMGRDGNIDELLSYTQIKSVNVQLRRGR
jgi:betaine-aldehyde dehydrogenase